MLLMHAIVRYGIIIPLISHDLIMRHNTTSCSADRTFKSAYFKRIVVHLHYGRMAHRTFLQIYIIIIVVFHRIQLTDHGLDCRNIIAIQIINHPFCLQTGTGHMLFLQYDISFAADPVCIELIYQFESRTDRLHRCV